MALGGHLTVPMGPEHRANKAADTLYQVPHCPSSGFPHPKSVPEK